MVVSTEKNIGSDTTVLNPEDVKVIAIKLPFDLQERILAFPFLHALHDRYPDAEIHFITPKKEIEVLNLLPFKAYYHEFDEDEILTVFDVHRYCAYAKIFNVDLFVSLTNSFADACLGLGLRAKKRLGFSDNWKTLVLTQKINRPIGHHITEDFFALYKEHIGGEVDTKLKVMSRELSPIVPEWDSIPYIAINLAPLRNGLVETEWIELFSHFENQRIVLFASDEQIKFLSQADVFLAKLNKKNVYVVFKYPTWIELARMLAFARGVISFSGPVTSYSCYTGTKTLILYDREDPQRFGPFYFLADMMILSVTDSGSNSAQTTSGTVIQPKISFDMSQVYEKAVDFFRLK